MRNCTRTFIGDCCLAHAARKAGDWAFCATTAGCFTIYIPCRRSPIGGNVHREILPFLIVALMFAIAFYAGPLVKVNGLVEIREYWGMAAGNDGWVDRTVGLYAIPVLALLFYAAMLAIPRFGLYKNGVREFYQQFWGFRVVFVFVMGAIYVSTL